MKNEINEKLLSNITMPEGMEKELYRNCISQKSKKVVAFRYANVILAATIVVAFVGMLARIGIRWGEKSRVSSDVQMVNDAHTTVLTAMMDPEVVNSGDYLVHDTSDIYQSRADIDNVSSGIEVTMPTVTDRKLIRNIALEVETQEFQELITTVTDRVKGLGGYIEDSNIYNGSNYSGEAQRNATMTLRVPSAQADAFLAVVADQSNITQQTENVNDVTLDYVDMECHKRVLQAEMDNMLELLEESRDIDDMIRIENRISDLRYQIESMESQLRTYDNKVDYTTIRLHVTEVQVLTEITEPEPEQTVTTWSRIADGFTDDLNRVITTFTDVLVVIISNLPSLLVLAVVVFIVIKILKKFIPGWDKSKESKKNKV